MQHIFKSKIIISILTIVFLQYTNLSQSQSNAIEGITQLVNDARVSIGVEPVVINAQLILAAQQHSHDMATNDSISHIGSDGSHFWERIALNDYNMIVGAEVVSSYPELNVNAVFYGWQDNLFDNMNILNPDFQEIGAAYAISESGKYYFAMLLAKRDDFILSITNTPTNIPIMPTQLPTITATTIPTLSTPTPLQPPTQIIPTNTLPPPTPFVTSTPISVAIFRPTQEAIVPPHTLEPTISHEVDLRIEYDYDKFTITNISGLPLWLEGLTFEGGGVEVDINIWNTAYLSASLQSFPLSGCLQAWDQSTQQQFDPPDTCNTRHAWMAFGERNIFWRDDLFTVYRYGEPLKVCVVSVGYCDIDLEERLSEIPASSQQTTINSQSNSDSPSNSSAITLVYDNVSFAIINTSNSILDLTGLGFSSTSGVMSISQWDTEYLSSPLHSFPIDDCLQAWPVTLQQYPEKPASCRIRHAWLGIPDYQTFWINTDVFSVSHYGTVLVTCHISSGTCEVDLP